jgi:SAM-dependent methyltransferase
MTDSARDPQGSRARQNPAPVCTLNNQDARIGPSQLMLGVGVRLECGPGGHDEPANRAPRDALSGLRHQLEEYVLASQPEHPYGSNMNSNHARVCPSLDWAEYLQNDVLPKATAGLELGSQMLEIGPGPGASTDWLRHRVARLSVIEIEADAASSLRERFAGTNVEVFEGDATVLPFEDDSFDAVGTFTMLHHVPTERLQNKVLAEALRVLRPGGVLVGSDSAPSTNLHDFHADDVYNPIDPGTLLVRLRTIGFDEVMVTARYDTIFSATKDKSKSS